MRSPYLLSVAVSSLLACGNFVGAAPRPAGEAQFRVTFDDGTKSGDAFDPTGAKRVNQISMDLAKQRSNNAKPPYNRLTTINNTLDKATGQWSASVVPVDVMNGAALRFEVPAGQPFAGRAEAFSAPATPENNKGTWFASLDFARFTAGGGELFELQLVNDVGVAMATAPVYYDAVVPDWRKKELTVGLPVGKKVSVSLEVDMETDAYRLYVDDNEAFVGKATNTSKVGGLRLRFANKPASATRSFAIDNVTFGQMLTGPLLSVGTKVTGAAGVDNLVSAPADAIPEITITAVARNRSSAAPLKGEVALEVYDHRGPVKTLAAQPIDLAPGGNVEVPFAFQPPGHGWYGVRAVTKSGGPEGPSTDGTAVAGSFAIVLPAAEGLRPDSMFGLAVGPKDADIEVSRLLGVKWRRGLGPQTFPGKVNPKPGEFWTEAQQADAVAAYEKWKAAGVLGLGFIDYNAPWNVRKDDKGKPLPNWASAPADMAAHAEMVYQLVKPFYPDVKDWELWNEGWGHYWQGGNADDHRAMTRAVWDRLKPEMPDVRLHGGSYYSYHLRNLIYAQGAENAGYVDSSATHPYGKPGPQTLLSPALEAAWNAKWAKGKGASGIWATEIGTPPWEFATHPEAERPFMVARTVAPIYLINKLGAWGMNDTPMRVFWFTSKYGGGGGPDDGFNLWSGTRPAPGIAAYSAMTHLLEDAKLEGDLFAPATDRWALLFSRADGSTVTVIWPDRKQVVGGEADTGTFTLPALDFEARDYLGRAVGEKVGDNLVIPTRTWEVTYLVSNRPAADVRAAIAGTRLEGWPAVAVTPLMFTQPVNGAAAPPVKVRVRNRLPMATDVTLTVDGGGALSFAQPTQSIAQLMPGEERVVDFAVTSAKPDASNRYALKWTSSAADIEQSGEQDLQVASATFGAAPTVDGDLAEWADVMPVSIRHKGMLASWEKEDGPPLMLSGDGYRVWVKWDDKNLYLAADVADRTPKFAWPQNTILNSDCLQFGFDVIDENPDDLLAGHPMRAKGLTSDMDYEFAVAIGQRSAKDAAAAAAASAPGGGGERGDGGFAQETAAASPADVAPPVRYGVLWRLAAPGTHFAEASADKMQNPPLTPYVGRLDLAAEGAQVAGVYDDAAKAWRVEAAMPLSLVPELRDRLAKLSPGETAPVRFAFVVNDHGSPGKNAWRRITTWQEEAGDVEIGAHGFAPRIGTPRWTNDYPLRLRTEWGFAR